MNRRDFMRFLPALSVLPFVGRWFQGDSTAYVDVSQTVDGPALSPWVAVSNNRFIVDHATVDTSKMAKDCWLDDDDHLIIETWDGEIITKRFIRTDSALSIETFRLNDAGEWETVA